MRKLLKGVIDKDEILAQIEEQLSPIPTQEAINNFKEEFFAERDQEIKSCVYIDEDLHNKLRIVAKYICNGKVTMGAYLNNIIEAHFEKHKHEIQYLHNQSHSDFQRELWRY